LQTLKTVTGPAPLVTEGSPATTCSISSGTGFSGISRTDTATTSDAGAFSTQNVAPDQSYVVYSLPYDLGTYNAGFITSPTLVTELNGGSIELAYSGSADGIVFSDPTSDLTTLSNRNYRYLKFQATLKTASIAAPTPQLKSISIPFSELNIRLVGGCGTTEDARRNRQGPWDWMGPLSILLWSSICFASLRLLRGTQAVHR
jgi:hypothetical protein